MNSFDFYFKQIVTQSVMDWAFAEVESADRSQNADSLSVGVMEGFEVTENNVGADMSVDVLQGVGYSIGGSRINNETPLTNINCLSDEYGVATPVQGGTNEKWLSVFARYDRRLEDPAIDGNNLQVYTRQYEDVEIVIRQGAEATAGAASRPPLMSGALLLCDIQLSFGQTSIQNTHLDFTRRQDWFRYEGSSIGSFVFGNPHDAVEEIFNILDGWASTGSPFSFSSSWGFGYAVEGPTPPVSSIGEALNAIPYDLGRTSGRTGGSLIGVANVSGTYLSWTAASLNSALSSLAGALNSHIGGGAPYHPATAITKAAVSGVIYSLASTNVDSAIANIVTWLNGLVIAPNPTGSTPQLLWRSHNVSSTAAITDKTLSMYWTNDGVYLIQGGFMAANHEITMRNSGGYLSFMCLTNGYFIFGDGGFAPNAVVAINDYDSFDTWNQFKSGSFTSIKQDNFFNCLFVGDHSTKSNPPVSKTRVFRIMPLALGVWCNGDSEYTGSFYIAYNAEWNNTTLEWTPEDPTGQKATVLEIGASGIILRNMTNESILWSSGWTDTGWQRTVKFSSLEQYQESELPSAHNYNCAQIDGDVFERCCVSGYSYTTTANGAIYCWVPVNFRNKRQDPPTTFSVKDTGKGSTNIGTVNVSTVIPTGLAEADYNHWGSFVGLASTWTNGDFGAAHLAAVVDFW